MNDQCALINNEQDLNAILEAEKKVIALVYARWCPFCIRFLPIFERTSTKYSNGKPQYFLLVQDDQEIVADKYEVDVVPTVLFFENGVISKRLDGRLGIGLTEKELTEFINKCNN